MSLLRSFVANLVSAAVTVGCIVAGFGLIAALVPIVGLIPAFVLGLVAILACFGLANDVGGALERRAGQDRRRDA